jgi:microcystin degradation protein MlrC
MWTNREMHLGPTATLRCGNLDVVVTSYPLQVTEPAYLTAAGVDVSSKKLIAIKSMQHFRAAFAPIVDDILFVDSGGILCTRFDRLPYRNVRRPIWPLDSEA